MSWVDIDMARGTTKEAHGKEWFILKTLGAGWYLAAEASDTFPADVKVILMQDEHDKYLKLRESVDEYQEKE